MTTYWLLGEKEPPIDIQDSTGDSTIPGSAQSLTNVEQTLGSSTEDPGGMGSSSLMEANQTGSGSLAEPTHPSEQLISGSGSLIESHIPLEHSDVSSPMLPRHQNSKTEANHNTITASTPLLQGDSG